jgi:RNA polymerase-binding protein DksA
MTVTDTESFRRILLEERDRVLRAIENLHNETPGSLEEATGEETSFDNHLGDTATVTYDREMDYTLEENSEAVLAAIDAALRRIEDGTYGTCAVCGREIPPERLEAVPWATLCIDDARKRGR